ncbi:MAG: peptidase [Deinococcus-Thermus bacterium]|nr:peptidase [Deinococcota bacterium]
MLSWAFLAFLVVAAASDLATLRIPNPLIVAGLALCLVRLAATPMPLGPHLAVGGVAFAITFALFAANLIGGGDAKLFPVTVLWFGPEQTPDFLLLLSVLAAGFALVLVLSRRLLPAVDGAPGERPAVLRLGAGVPLAVPTLPAAALFL